MKYKLTQLGMDDFKQNKRQYLTPTVKSKIMFLLSCGVGFTLGSISSQVRLDPRIKTTEGEVVATLQNLIKEGYVEVTS